jgi:hypothetical protein
VRSQEITRFWICDFGFWIGRPGRKKIFCLALGALLFALSVPAAAQQAAKIHHRIGVLSAVDSASFTDNADALGQGLRDLGYVEGQNLTIEFRYADGKIDHLPELAAELVRLKVAALVVSSSPAVSASRQAGDRLDDSTERAGAGGQGGSVKNAKRIGQRAKGNTSTRNTPISAN